jgi:hypothetical protein
MNSAITETRSDLRPAENTNHVSRSASLQAKGSCWYCDKPVDNVRRFCSHACRDDYFEEESEHFQ